MYDNPNAAHSNVLAFFELSNSPHMGRDSNTPERVGHIAFALGEHHEFLVCKTPLEKMASTCLALSITGCLI